VQCVRVSVDWSALHLTSSVLYEPIYTCVAILMRCCRLLPSDNFVVCGLVTLDLYLQRAVGLPLLITFTYCGWDSTRTCTCACPVVLVVSRVPRVRARHSWSRFGCVHAQADVSQDALIPWFCCCTACRGVQSPLACEPLDRGSRQPGNAPRHAAAVLLVREARGDIVRGSSLRRVVGCWGAFCNDGAIGCSWEGPHRTRVESHPHTCGEWPPHAAGLLYRRRGWPIYGGMSESEVLWTGHRSEYLSVPLLYVLSQGRTR